MVANVIRHQQAVLLCLRVLGPSHLSAIARWIQAAGLEETVAPIGPSSIWPALRKLEEFGDIERSAEAVYRLSDPGVVRADTLATKLRSFVARLETSWDSPSADGEERDSTMAAPDNPRISHHVDDPDPRVSPTATHRGGPRVVPPDATYRPCTACGCNLTACPVSNSCCVDCDHPIQ